MHAEAAHAGGNFQWASYFTPEPELVARYEAAQRDSEPDWTQLEPEFSL